MEKEQHSRISPSFLFPFRGGRCTTLTWEYIANIWPDAVQRGWTGWGRGCLKIMPGKWILTRFSSIRITHLNSIKPNYALFALQPYLYPPHVHPGQVIQEKPFLQSLVLLSRAKEKMNEQDTFSSQERWAYIEHNKHPGKVSAMEQRAVKEDMSEVGVRY